MSDTDTGTNEGGQTGAGVEQMSRRHKKYARGTTRQDKALDLAQRLLVLQRDERFTEFKDDLESAIRRVRFQGGRTETSDRDLILSALETGCAEIDEFVDETELSEKDVRAALDWMVNNDLVEMRERGRSEGARGAARIIYVLRSTQPGTEFFTRRSQTVESDESIRLVA